MITSNQRKQIERMAYDAVKALTGEQLELKLIGYSNAKVHNEDVYNGSFEFEITNREHCNYTYRMTVKDYRLTNLTRDYDVYSNLT